MTQLNKGQGTTNKCFSMTNKEIRTRAKPELLDSS